MGRLIPKLKRLSKEYSYRNLKWVTKIPGPIHFPDQRTIVMPGFYSSRGSARKSVCTEVMNHSYLKLGNGRNNLHQQGRLYRVSGSDPVYFQSCETLVRDERGNIVRRAPISKGEHVFLAITDKRIAPNETQICKEGAREALLEGNAIIFDPSFGVVEPLAESQYTIDKLWSPGYELQHKTGSAIFENQGPGQDRQIIGMSSGLIVSCNMYYGEDQRPQEKHTVISFMGPGNTHNGDISIYDPSLDYLTRHVEGFDIFLDHMRRICLTEMRGENIDEYMTQVVVK